MAVTSLRRSGLTGLIKYDRFTAGNESDFALIASQTVGSGGASSITFSNIPQDYRHLQVRGIAFSSNAAHGDLRFNGDSGNNYAGHSLEGNGSSAGSYAGTSRSDIFSVFRITSSTTPGAAVCDILDYSNTNKNKVTRTLRGFDDNGSGSIEFISGLWMSTSAVTSITIIARSGSFSQNTTLSLYGVR